MTSTKIPINFDVATSDLRPEQEIQKELGYIFNNHWRLRITKGPYKNKYAPFLIIERNKCVPETRIRVDLKFINLDTKREVKYFSKGLCKERAMFRLRLNLFRNMLFSGYTVAIRGELEIHSLPNAGRLPSPQTFITLSADFKQLCCNQKFSDLVIRCGSEVVPAHKNILTARCPVFAEMLLSTPNEAKLNINDLDPVVLKAVLYYIYSGKTEHLTFRTACGLLNAASKYRLNELKMICVDFIKCSFTLENIFDYFYKFEEVQCYALDFIAKNISFIENTKQWKDFKDERPDLAAELLERKY